VRDPAVAARFVGGPAVIWMTVLVVVFLFIYLLAALLRPEWF
jgi:K+-transporting ATPase KdpF subunit